MFPMGSEDLNAFPNNVIYNVYAKCDKNAYENVSGKPFSSGDPFGTGIAEQNNQFVNCTITIVSPDSFFESEGSIHLIGFGSRLYKKLTWAFKFDKKFLGRKAVKLRAMANDPTLVREKVTTELYKAAGIPVQEGTYARLFINDDTYGLYTIMDSLSKKWISSYIHRDTIEDIGFSYKLYAHIPTYPNFKYMGDNYEDYTELYVPDEYEDDAVDPNNESSHYTHIMRFIKLFDTWVNTPNQPIEELSKFFNIELTLRIMVIDTLVLALDNFWLRMSNVALYYNPEKDNYILLPYDFDKTLGGSRGDPMLNPASYISDCYTWANQHEEKIDHYFTNTLLKHPKIRARYDVILKKASTELFTKDVVGKYIDEVASLIRDDVQWNNDKSTSLVTAYKGYLNHYTFENFEGNLNYSPVGFKENVVVNDAEFGVKQWVELRSESCKAATVNVDASNNENISDNEEVDVYNGVNSLFTSHSFTLIFILSQFVLFFIL